MKTGIELIAEERQRQISREVWTQEHDDTHTRGEIVNAAACYLASGQATAFDCTPSPMILRFWPWGSDAWKPSSSPIRDLVKAGALIAAEIDRLSRLEMAPEASDVDAILQRAASPNHGKRLTP